MFSMSVKKMLLFMKSILCGHVILSHSSCHGWFIYLFWNEDIIIDKNGVKALLFAASHLVLFRFGTLLWASYFLKHPIWASCIVSGWQGRWGSEEGQVRGDSRNPRWAEPWATDWGEGISRQTLSRYRSMARFSSLSDSFLTQFIFLLWI